MKNALIFSGMGLELGSGIIAAKYLAPHLETQWPALAGKAFGVLALLFMASWFIHLILLLRRFNKNL